MSGCVFRLEPCWEALSSSSRCFARSRRTRMIAVKVRVPPNRREDLIREVSLKRMALWDEFGRRGGARELLALSHKMMHDAAVDLVRSLGRQRATLSTSPQR